MSDHDGDPTGPGTTEILLAAASVALITIGVSSTAWWIAGRPTSEWPAWVEAGATVAAVGAAIVAGFYAARAFGLEFQRERRWEDGQRSAQAALVSAWYVRQRASKGSPDNATGAFPDYVVIGAVVRLKNSSLLPIWDVRITVGAYFEDRSRPSPTPLSELTIPRFDPETSQDLAVTGDPVALASFGTAIEKASDLTYVVRLTFRDSANGYWLRDHRGNLHALPSWDDDPAVRLRAHLHRNR